MPIQKITPMLWYDHQAQEAAEFYTSIFPNSRIERVLRYGDAGNGPAGAVMTVEFQLEGQSFVALNGGPLFQFSEAISFVVDCESQDEVDFYWERLRAGGAESRCGWLKDRFGVSWQIVPNELLRLLGDPDPKKAARVTRAMLTMIKIDVGALRDAANQG